MRAVPSGAAPGSRVRGAVFFMVLALVSGCNSVTGTQTAQVHPVTLDPAFSGNPTAPSAPVPTPSATMTATLLPAGTYLQKIEEIASTSSCAKYNWSGRGVAPSGYIQGMAATFARSLCRLKGRSLASAPANRMAQANGASSSDALTWYGLQASSTPEDTLRTDFTLGMGLGMRESSGQYCTGWDTTAGPNRPSSAGEAGLFQTSYDSISATSELQVLYTEYQNDPSRCLLHLFKEGVSCGTQGVLGTGAGADYQTFTRSCPAFAAEYAMTLLRVLRSHFGPIIRKEAEVVSACSQMLSDVQDFVDQQTNGACRDVK